MIVTIVTLYRGKMVEHFVGAVEGQLTDAQRHELANKWGAHYHSREEGDEPEGDDVEDRDEICFRTSTVAKSPADLTHLMNIDDDGVTLNQWAGKESS